MKYRPEYPVTSLSKPFPAGDIQPGWAFDATVDWIDSMARPMSKSGQRKRSERMIAKVQHEWAEETPIEQRLVHGRALVLANHLDKRNSDRLVAQGYLAAHSMAVVRGVIPVDYDPGLYEDLAMAGDRLRYVKNRNAFRDAAWKGMQRSHERTHSLARMLHDRLTLIHELTRSGQDRQKLGIALFYILATHGHLLTTAPNYNAMTEVNSEPGRIYHLDDLVVNEASAVVRRPGEDSEE